MGQQFRIEGDEAAALAAELAALTGTSLETAVTAAVRQQLARERERQQWMMRVTAGLAGLDACLDTSGPPPDHDELLYDEHTGLPK